MEKQTDSAREETIHAQVRRHYGSVAGVARTRGCCAEAGETDGRETSGGTCTCSGDSTAVDRNDYTDADLASQAAEANLGLGCGNPLLTASLGAGECVLDLGSGAGFDVFLAADRVGEAGRVIGVDMTPEMIERAREIAQQRDVTNVEFRLGEIEHLPVESQTIDVVISNCVVNLSPRKDLVFREAYRVLKPGGRLAIADIVAIGPIPEEVRSDLSRFVECISGAVDEPTLRALLKQVGFRHVSIAKRARGAEPSSNASEAYLASAVISASKPKRRAE